MPYEDSKEYTYVFSFSCKPAPSIIQSPRKQLSANFVDGQSRIIYLFTCSIHLFIKLFVSMIQLVFCLFIYLFLLFLYHLFSYLSIYLFAYLFIHLFIDVSKSLNLSLLKKQ